MGRLEFKRTRAEDSGSMTTTVAPCTWSMYVVTETVLPGYVAALERALDGAVARLPQGRARVALLRLRRRLGDPYAAGRFEALERLVVLGETQGWIDGGEAIVIRKLAYRVSFFLRRAGIGEEGRGSGWLWRHGDHKLGGATD